MFFLVAFMIWCAIAVINLFWIAAKMMLWLALAILAAIVNMLGGNMRYPSLWWVL